MSGILPINNIDNCTDLLRFFLNQQIHCINVLFAKEGFIKLFLAITFK